MGGGQRGGVGAGEGGSCAPDCLVDISSNNFNSHQTSFRSWGRRQMNGFVCLLEGARSVLKWWDFYKIQSEFGVGMT